jgi:hypothetical protein
MAKLFYKGMELDITDAEIEEALPEYLIAKKMNIKHNGFVCFEATHSGDFGSSKRYGPCLIIGRVNLLDKGYSQIRSNRFLAGRIKVITPRQGMPVFKSKDQK